VQLVSPYGDPTDTDTMRAVTGSEHPAELQGIVAPPTVLALCDLVRGLVLVVDDPPRAVGEILGAELDRPALPEFLAGDQVELPVRVDVPVERELRDLPRLVGRRDTRCVEHVADREPGERQLRAPDRVVERDVGIGDPLGLAVQAALALGALVRRRTGRVADTLRIAVGVSEIFGRALDLGGAAVNFGVEVGVVAADRDVVEELEQVPIRDLPAEEVEGREREALARLELDAADLPVARIVEERPERVVG